MAKPRAIQQNRHSRQARDDLSQYSFAAVKCLQLMKKQSYNPQMNCIRTTLALRDEGFVPNATAMQPDQSIIESHN